MQRIDVLLDLAGQNTLRLHVGRGDRILQAGIGLHFQGRGLGLAFDRQLDLVGAGTDEPPARRQPRHDRLVVVDVVRLVGGGLILRLGRLVFHSGRNVGLHFAHELEVFSLLARVGSLALQRAQEHAGIDLAAQAAVEVAPGGREVERRGDGRRPCEGRVGALLAEELQQRVAAQRNADRVAGAVDQSPAALEVYRLNFPGHDAWQLNLENVTAEELQVFGADFWWLSPPCQPYTVRGAGRDFEDPRALSFRRILDVMARMKENRLPLHLALENVEGFTRSEMRKQSCLV